MAEGVTELEEYAHTINYFKDSIFYDQRGEGRKNNCFQKL